ncbi:SGNH/GDSL hydrolase family protein [Opitutaceae bacterium]|nr:SGNH/GDSL hydrolase family protein [Opitutaceae bacterium]
MISRRRPQRVGFIAFVLALLLPAATLADAPIRGGDRIAIVGNTFADQLRTHGYLETFLLNQTRENPVSIRNLGWGGDTLTIRNRPTNFPTEESTLKAHQTDVIIACFGMGESFAGEAGIEAFQSDLEAFIGSHAEKSYNGNSPVRLVLVSPIAYEDLGELTPAVKQRNRDLADYTEAMGAVAATNGIPFINLFEPSRTVAEARVGPRTTTNGIHLNPYGYWAISRSLGEQLLSDRTDARVPSWEIRIDAAARKSEAAGVSVIETFQESDELVFVIGEDTPPSLPPPSGETLPPSLARQRDALTVENLEPGTYALRVDGQTVATASHDAWARGVFIDSSPAHHAAESYRANVIDKNLQFIYGWKALNQVHIVGERRHSPSGRALPGEIVEFNNLTNQADEALREGLELKVRTWRLVPVSP